MRLALLLCLLLAACGRPLTDGERAFLRPLHGGTLDADRARIVRAPVGIFPIDYDLRPRTACRERIGPPRPPGRIRVPTAGIVLFDTLFAGGTVARDDYSAPRADGRLDLPLAMYFAHEMTHVWQWQNRRVTGYAPWKAVFEQLTVDDPYLFGDVAQPFLAQPYEVQASLVEEYLCCATLDPGGARTGRLFATLSQVMPVAEPSAFPRAVWVPWEGDLEGICR